jgi:hypothetical protein
MGGWEMDESDSESCPVVGFGINSVEYFGCAIKALVI